MSRFSDSLTCEEVPFEGDSPIPIDQLHPRQVARIKQIEANNDDITRLKAMGICQGRRVQLIQAGDPLIVRVLGVRIGLSARLASHVIVEPCRRHC